jgi:antirestriction protein
MKDITKVKELIGEYGIGCVRAFADNGNDIDSIATYFEDSYQGEWPGKIAYAEYIIDECYDLEKTMGNLANYFDYESFARDLFIDGHWSVDAGNNTIYVFQDY